MLPCLVNLRSHPRRTSQSRHCDESILFRPFFSCATHSSKFRTLFQVPYPLSPLLATLTKTAGVCPNSSHFGTSPARKLPQPLPHLSLAPRPVPLAQSLRPQMTIPLFFQTFAHSFALFCTSTNLNCFIFKLFRTLRQKTSVRASRSSLAPNSQRDRLPADHGNTVHEPRARVTNHFPTGCRTPFRMLRFGIP